MKLVIYTLNSDGTTPSYIVDGGYLPSDNGGEFPQNLNLVGLATSEAIQNGFNSQLELLSYAQKENIKPIDKIVQVSLETIVSSIWSKLGGNQ